MSTGKFICLEEDNDEWTSMVLYGASVVPPAPIPTGITPRLRRRLKYIEAMQTWKIENPLAYKSKEDQELLGLLDFPEFTISDLEKILGKERVQMLLESRRSKHKEKDN